MLSAPGRRQEAKEREEAVTTSPSELLPLSWHLVKFPKVPCKTGNTFLRQEVKVTLLPDNVAIMTHPILHCSPSRPH